MAASQPLWLRVDDPADGSNLVCLVAEAVIGRDLQCEVVVHDAEVSRRHAQLAPVAGGEWRVNDLDTTNGTFVNGARIVGPAPIRRGDRIGVGRVCCTVVAPPTSS